MTNTTNTTNTTVTSEVKTTSEVAKSTNTTKSTISIITLKNNGIKRNSNFLTPKIVKEDSKKTFENALNAELKRRYTTILQHVYSENQIKIDAFIKKVDNLKEGETLPTEELDANNKLVAIQSDVKESLDELSQLIFDETISDDEKRIVRLYAHLIEPRVFEDADGKLQAENIIYSDIKATAIIDACRTYASEYINDNKQLVPDIIMSQIETLFSATHIEKSTVFKTVTFKKGEIAKAARRMLMLGAKNYQCNKSGKIKEKEGHKNPILIHTLLCMMFLQK